MFLDRTENGGDLGAVPGLPNRVTGAERNRQDGTAGVAVRPELPQRDRAIQPAPEAWQGIRRRTSHRLGQGGGQKRAMGEQRFLQRQAGIAREPLPAAERRETCGLTRAQQPDLHGIARIGPRRHQKIEWLAAQGGKFAAIASPFGLPDPVLAGKSCPGWNQGMGGSDARFALHQVWQKRLAQQFDGRIRPGIVQGMQQRQGQDRVADSPLQQHTDPQDRSRPASAWTDQGHGVEPASRQAHTRETRGQRRRQGRGVGRQRRTVLAAG